MNHVTKLFNRFVASIAILQLFINIGPNKRRGSLINFWPLHFSSHIFTSMSLFHILCLSISRLSFTQISYFIGYSDKKWNSHEINTFYHNFSSFFLTVAIQNLQNFLKQIIHLWATIHINPCHNWILKKSTQNVYSITCIY